MLSAFASPLAALLSCLLLAICGQSVAETDIPFEFRDGLIWVKVKAAGSETPLYFLVDSGAGSSVVNWETAQRLRLASGAAINAQRVSQTVAAAHLRDFHATVGGISLGTAPLAMDLSHTSAYCCRTIDGLIGQDFFRGRVVQIDFKNTTLRLLEHAEDAERATVMKLRLDHAAFCVALSVNGCSPKWTRLDTGCDDGLHWVGSSNGSVRTSLQLGGERIENVKTALHRGEIFPGEAGLLGNGVLANYRVTIDAVKGRLLLSKA